MALTLNELKRLGTANKILNRSSKRLGIKPLMINDIREELKKTASEVRKEVIKERKEESKKPNNASLFPLIILFSLLLLVGGFYLFKIQSKTAFDDTLPSKNTIVKLNDNFDLEKDPELIITKGSYANRTEAEKAKRYLERRIGGDLKVINTGNFFTVQLGPNYINHEDAFIVFDELAKYGLKDLSINSL